MPVHVSATTMATSANSQTQNNNYYLLHPRADDHAQRLFGRRTDQRVSYLTCRPLKLASFSADGQVSAEQPPDCMCR